MLQKPKTHHLKPAYGFTLIEILAVLGIIAIVTSVAFTMLNRFRQQTDIDSAASGILSALRLARSQTLASEDALSYGVYFESAMHTRFYGRSFIPGSPLNDVVALPSSITIASVDLSTSVPVVIFDRLTGFTSTTGTIRLEGVFDSSQSRLISIYASGEAGMTATGIAPTDNRLADTRHVHFGLMWTIRDATVLRLRFFNPPNPDVVNDITMLPEPPRASFSYEGDTAVGGENQHLAIRAHVIGSTDTLLSIRRDRDKNSKAVDVSIIDGIEKAIASYTASGTVSLGAFGGTMTIQ